MDYTNYTEILGDILVEIGFKKEKFTDDGRYKYTKQFSFGKLSFLDGNKHFKDSIFIDKFNSDGLNYVYEKPKTLNELVQLLVNINYEQGVEAGKRSKIYEIKSVLELED